jgi:hypothetical protein
MKTLLFVALSQILCQGSLATAQADGERAKTFTEDRSVIANHRRATCLTPYREADMVSRRIGLLLTQPGPRDAQIGWQTPTQSTRTRLSNYMKGGVRQVEPTTLNPTTYLSLRAGAMVSPRGAGLIGLDAALPRLSLGPNWHGRLDVDVIISANFANTNTAVPITLNQIYYRPQTGNVDFYGGFGVGAMLGREANFTGKLILGATFTPRAAAELNIHLTDRSDTLVMLLGRFRL